MQGFLGLEPHSPAIHRFTVCALCYCRCDRHQGEGASEFQLGDRRDLLSSEGIEVCKHIHTKASFSNCLLCIFKLTPTDPAFCVEAQVTEQNESFQIVRGYKSHLF